MENTSEPQSTAVSVIFPDQEHAELALRTLSAEGFETEDLNVLTSATHAITGHEPTDGADHLDPTTAGAMLGGGAGAALGASLVAIGAFVAPGVGVLASGPWLAAATGIAAGGTAGGLIGGLVGATIPEEGLEIYKRDLAEGAVLISYLGSEEEVAHVRRVALRSGARDIQTY